MKIVKVLESFHVAATGMTYKKGQEAEFSDELAERHEKTGFVEIKIEQPEPIAEKLKKAK